MTERGSIAAEISLEYMGLSLSSLSINSSLFDTANPGDSPYLPGSPEGGDSVGMAFEPELMRAFAPYGSSVIDEPGTYTFLTFGYELTSPVYILSASGLVAQQGEVTSGLSAHVSAFPPVCLDFDGNCMVGDGDLTLLLANWGQPVPPIPSGWIGAAPTAPGIGDDELTTLLSTWGQTAQGPLLTTPTPEPSTALLSLIGLVIASRWRRRA